MTKDFFSKYLYYKDGCLYWNCDISRKKRAHSRAGSRGGNGRIQVRINSKNYSASVITYTLHYGTPIGEVDHINRNPADNRIENLRDVSKRDNSLNTSHVINRKRELPPCVYFDPTNKKNHYYIRCRVGGRKRVVGWAKTPEEAYLKYKEMFALTPL